MTILSILAVIDYNPFRSSQFNPYHGDVGMKLYQELIDYVNGHGGYACWNYPEQRSGVRGHGLIHVKTPPYPQVLHQTHDYAGFSTIYGDNLSITNLRAPSGTPTI